VFCSSSVISTSPYNEALSANALTSITVVTGRVGIAYRMTCISMSS
jgi:hypothetical protein